ncbi:sulfurtransferase [Glutamicibacter uratoxydans]|uniref:Sulfurtransferase n=2 Tax=Glutamicibacter uratoxydans TaxID=43667 RepID=A0A4Y4DLH4_GLUUR|nr:sulfurtransferase [Glutamicibacter uratoxydans]
MELSPFVDIGWLKSHREQVVVADVRWYLDGSSGAQAYRRGHIPGAVFVDLDRWLSGESGPRGLNPLPTPDVFAQGMGSLGIGDDSTVIAYDDAGGVIAARLVWMLRALGKSSALLDGGISSWGGPLETSVPQPSVAQFSATAWPASMLASADDVDQFPGLVVDARNPERFNGSLQVPSDPQPGHIPGAVNVPCRRNLDAAGQLLPATQVRENFYRADVTDATATISYCGSGVTACHNLLVMEHLGMGRGRLYPGGWSHYAALENRIAEL